MPDRQSPQTLASPPDMIGKAVSRFAPPRTLWQDSPDLRQLRRGPTGRPAAEPALAPFSRGDLPWRGFVAAAGGRAGLLPPPTRVLSFDVSIGLSFDQTDGLYGERGNFGCCCKRT